MDLYHFPISPFSHKVRLSLIEKDITHNEKAVFLNDAEQMANFRKIHPIGKLPVLDVDGTLIPESSIIVEYLDQHFGGPKHIPEQKDDALQVRLKDRWVDQYLSDTAITVFFQSMRPKDQQDQKKIQQCIHRIHETYVFIDKELQGKADDAFYFHGDSWTLADLALLPSLRIASNIQSFASFSNITRYFEQHLQRDSFQMLLPEADAAFEKFMSANT